MLGGVAHNLAKMANFQIGPLVLLSDHINSRWTQYEILKVWFNKIDHIPFNFQLKVPFLGRNVP